MLIEYVRELRNFENVDFKKEIGKVEEKIKLINEANKVVNSDPKNK